jgi:hypothetical protein
VPVHGRAEIDEVIPKEKEDRHDCETDGERRPGSPPELVIEKLRQQRVHPGAADASDDKPKHALDDRLFYTLSIHVCERRESCLFRWDARWK